MAVPPGELKDWVTVLFERSNAALSLWNFESLVVVGILSFLATAKEDLKTPAMRGLIAVCFLIFAIFNGFAIYQATLAQTALFAGLQPLLAKSPFSGLAGLTVTAPWEVNIAVHAIIDCALLYTILKKF